MHDETDPHALFARWFAEAQVAEPRVPDAMQVATAGADGVPDVRTVLLKRFGPEGWWFYTNLGSPKAAQLAERPVASCLLHWKSLERQVRVLADVAPATDADADAYFASRARGSQLGAWASDQSAELDDRATLEARLAEVTTRFEGQPVPRPPFWGGYHLTLRRMEFWQGRPDRLHDRRVYTRDGDAWAQQVLYP